MDLLTTSAKRKKCLRRKRRGDNVNDVQLSPCITRPRLVAPPSPLVRVYDFSVQEDAYLPLVTEALDEFRALVSSPHKRSAAEMGCPGHQPAEANKENTSVAEVPAVLLTPSSQSCPVCNRAFGVGLLGTAFADHVNACLDGSKCDTSSSAVTACCVCHKDLSHMADGMRVIHVNTCLDTAKSPRLPTKTRQANRTKLTLPACPVCGFVFAAEGTSLAHLKRCAVQHGMTTNEMIKKIEQQRQQPTLEAMVAKRQHQRQHQQPRLVTAESAEVEAPGETPGDTLRRVEKVHRNRTNCVVPKKLLHDEELQMALALSSSLAPELQVKRKGRLTKTEKGLRKPVPALLITSSAEKRSRVQGRFINTVQETGGDSNWWLGDRQQRPQPPSHADHLQVVRQLLSEFGSEEVVSQHNSTSLWHVAGKRLQQPGAFSTELFPAAVDCQEHESAEEILLDLAGNEPGLVEHDLAIAFMDTSNFVQDFAALVDCAILSDVLLTAQEGPAIYGHRLLLTARCPKLTLPPLLSSSARSQAAVLAVDAPRRVVLAMLQYAYTGQTAFEVGDLGSASTLAKQWGLGGLAAGLVAEHTAATSQRQPPTKQLLGASPTSDADVEVLSSPMLGASLVGRGFVSPEPVEATQDAIFTIELDSEHSFSDSDAADECELPIRTELFRRQGSPEGDKDFHVDDVEDGPDEDLLHSYWQLSKPERARDTEAAEEDDDLMQRRMPLGAALRARLRNASLPDDPLDRPTQTDLCTVVVDSKLEDGLADVGCADGRIEPVETVDEPYLLASHAINDPKWLDEWKDMPTDGSHQGCMEQEEDGDADLVPFCTATAKMFDTHSLGPDSQQSGQLMPLFNDSLGHSRMMVAETPEYHTAGDIVSPSMRDMMTAEWDVLSLESSDSGRCSRAAKEQAPPQTATNNQALDPVFQVLKASLLYPLIVQHVPLQLTEFARVLGEAGVQMNSEKLGAALEIYGVSYTRTKEDRRKRKHDEPGHRARKKGQRSRPATKVTRQ